MADVGTSGPDLARLFVEYRASGSRRLRNELIEAHRGLAATIASDYNGRGIETDDLRQVALVGLLKAVERFDPERGVPFSAFASRTINGEIKRYFRDHAWAVRPPRSIQELHLQVRKATEELMQRHGRAPTIPELAGYLDVDNDAVLEALEAREAFGALSMDAPGPNGADDSPQERPSHEAGYQQAEVQMFVGQLLSTLPDREATILRLYFFDELTQSEIADEVGVSQMHVSRLLRRSLSLLRARAGSSGPPPDQV